MATSVKLNCFVSRGFNQVVLDHVARVLDHELPESEKIKIQKRRLVRMSRLLARIQIQSLEHLDKLRDAGCAHRGPKHLSAMIEKWAEEGGIPPFVTDYGVEDFVERAPKLMAACSRLATYNIPCTLVHGDFHIRNATFTAGNSERIMLFDWQYSYIGHPFFDFHILHWSAPEEVVEEYLKMWSAFEGMERAKEAYQLARYLGMYLKMWSDLDFLEECNYQVQSSLVQCAETVLDLAWA